MALEMRPACERCGDLFGCWRKRVSVATSARSVFTVPGSCVIDVPIAVVNSSHGPRDPKMMREEILTGEYLCGTVRYEVTDRFSASVILTTCAAVATCSATCVA